ncbi:MAG: alpha-2-macroglobulin family protein, partial [Saprospiraceae bacterium]
MTKVEFLPEKEKKTDVFHDLYENNTAMKEIGRGSFNLGYDGENPVLFTIIDRRNKKQIYRKDVRNFYNLFPGEYELYMLFPKGYYSLDFEVRANTKSYIRLPEELTLKSDKYEQTIWDIFGKDYLWDEDIFNISHDKILGEYNIIIDKENNVMKPILKGELVKVNGLITDEMGDPIVFANVMVRYYEDDYVAITDYDGFYEISIPNDAKELLVTYIGYEDQIIDLSKDNYGMHNMTMTEGVLLDAVVVTALGISRDEKSMGYAAVSLSSLESRSTGVALSGKVSGIQITNSSGRLGDNIDLKIRGASSVSAGNEPLYIINGVPISAEKAKELDADLIQGINVLKEDAAVAIYGAVAKNGAIIITLKEGTNTDFLQEELSGFQMRENFSDYAYWQPNLKTDKNGMAIFTAKLPDDITGWNTYVLGMDNKKRGGVSVVDFMAYKKLMAELSVPRFAVEGDSINIIGQANNYTQDSLD